ncbi:hypothetical protein F5Y18DRAFT_393994 [Xylariaceae sp. FL1019]|nr:hypothetical protein F5Y18DRAFT_393994 [Xylariaceae sp. FL1019]
MGSWTAFLLTYLLGGVTFIPLVVAAILLHAHLTFPVRDHDVPLLPNDPESIVQPADDIPDFDIAQKEEDKQKLLADSDVAAGYFAVCREYTPMGINAKPIERTTPVGSTTVAAPSPSVYQSMYRSIFDRKQTPGPLDDNKSVSLRPKRAGNVFYVVLRHGHLMLFDDDEQLEVRHVVSLVNHNVSIYSGGDCTPEGELFIKRNAICLTRRVDGKGLTPDTPVSKPFYLFSENCSAKEDFYFALLRNQEQSFSSQNIAPKPLRFDVKNIISLVQKLHSSDDHMQTRWLNALIGRIFLGLYKTKDIENLIKEKLTKKISRVKRPGFLTRVAIQGINVGESAPYISNPRLKDLNVEGDCVMEADLKYTGKFRLEVAATARIDLGTRFKAREVNLVLAVVLRKLEGHVFFKIKPPPSNRLWFSFQSMPKIEMTIEPIVSSRQITYTVILRQIENRIKEVIAETLVLPSWDDTPFFSTEHKEWRGGIFEGDDAVEHSADHASIAAELGNVDEVSEVEHTPPPMSHDLPQLEKSVTEPNSDSGQPTGFWSRTLGKKGSHLNPTQQNSASTTALDAKNSYGSSGDIPRLLRSGSFSASSPTISTEPTHVEASKPTTTPPDSEDAASTNARLSARSSTQSPVHTPVGSPTKSTTILEAHVPPSNSSSEAINQLQDSENTPKGQMRRDTASSVDSASNDHSQPDNPLGVVGRQSTASSTGSASKGLFGRKETPSPNTGQGTPDNKRNTLAAVSNAAATAKRWGLNAIQRQTNQNNNGRKLSDPPVDLNLPMGRGQPLPPPGTPLPRPGQKATPLPVPKRKPVSSPPKLTPKSSGDLKEPKIERRSAPPPPLPRRRRVSQIHDTENTEDNLLVVEAPADSEPNSPSIENTSSSIQPRSEELEGSEENQPSSAIQKSSLPQLPEQSGDGLIQAAPDNMGRYEEDDEYSNWTDNPEFKEDDNTQTESQNNR